MILRQLMDNGFIGTMSDLVHWATKTGESEKFFHDRAKSYLVPNERFDMALSLAFMEIIDEACQELRQPLVLSDFVNLNKPKKIPIHRGWMSSEESLERSYRSALKRWNNWAPLFEGFETVVEWPDRTSINNRKGNCGVTFWTGDTPEMTGARRIKSRESFIRSCKEHNINLLTK